jgi:hypothetical protein
VEESKQKQEELLSSIIRSENSLARQLKNSEDGPHFPTPLSSLLTSLPVSAANERHERTKASLRNEFLKQKQSNLLKLTSSSGDQQQQKREMDRVEREFLKSQERQRQAKQDAAARYQQLLDQQLQERREKSLATLKGTLHPLLSLSLSPLSLPCLPFPAETMAPREKEMNAELFRRFGIQPT